jgi:ATP-binding cassette subfamily F protein 3
MTSKDVLKQALIQYEGSVIVVSHDRDFLEGLTNRTLEFREQKLHNYIGDVYAFLEKREMDNMRDVEKMTKQSVVQEEANVPEVKLSYEEQRELQKERRRIEKKVETSEKEIEKLEVLLGEMQVKMAHSDFYGSPEETKIIEKYQAAQAKLEKVMQDWEEAQAALESFLELNDIE